MVQVYILSNDPKSEKVKKLKHLFSHNLFIVNIISPECKDIKAEEESDCEYNRCVSALNDSHRHNSNDHTIIVRDSSISIASPELMADIVKTTIDSGDFDICYLSKWSSRCDLYTNKKPIENTSAVITKTQTGSGIQALLLSPNGRDIILRTKPMKNGKLFEMKKKSDLGYNLGQEIFKNNISSICIVPNLIEYDVTEATSNEDYKKSHACDVPGMDSSSTDGSSGWIFTILVIIIIILIIWGIYKLRNNYY